MKSEVKTKFPNSEDQNFLSLASQDDHQRFVGACVRAVGSGFNAPAAVSADSLDRALR
jgi:hypothetical protein